MKIVFFGTSNVALPVLESLNRRHTILAVVTGPDGKTGRKQELKESPVSVLAREMGLKMFKPLTVKNNDLFRQGLLGLNADVFVVVSYGKILPKDIIEIPKLKTLNIHFSKLPKYRGASPMQFALLNGDAETAITVFVLDEKMDEGPVLGQKTFYIDPDDNFLTLSEKMAHASGAYILEILKDYENGSIVPFPQDESLASYTKIIEKSDGRVNWEKTAAETYNQFRAFYPWPGVWFEWRGKKVKIMDCKIYNPNKSNTATQIPRKEIGLVLENGLVVCGQETLLEIKSLQMEGKKETTVTDFLNGYRDFVGSRLV